jgi:hypothetical protein
MLTFSMLRAATGLGWGEVLHPHGPGLVLAAVLGSLVWGVDLGFKSLGVTSHLLVLVVQNVVAGLAGIAALRWTPFPMVANVVGEIVGDISPKLAALLAPGAVVERAPKTGRPRAPRPAVESETP